MNDIDRSYEVKELTDSVLSLLLLLILCLTVCHRTQPTSFLSPIRLDAAIVKRGMLPFSAKPAVFFYQGDADPTHSRETPPIHRCDVVMT